jgi:hypothetical protein
MRPRVGDVTNEVDQLTIAIVDARDHTSREESVS